MHDLIYRLRPLINCLKLRACATIKFKMSKNERLPKYLSVFKYFKRTYGIRKHFFVSKGLLKFLKNFLMKNGLLKIGFIPELKKKIS